MANMKSSRKGMQLNDTRYFRLPLPHMRKRMMLIHVISRISDLRTNHFHLVQDSNLNSGLGFKSRLPNRGKMLELKQSSVEITLMTYDGEFDTDENKKMYQDAYVETEITKSASNSSLLGQKDSLGVVQGNTECLTDVPQTEDNSKKIVQKIVHHEQSCNHIKRNYKSIEWKRNYDDCVIEEEEKYSNWWKDSGQTILHFFTKILGKRVGIATKKPADHILSATKQHGKRVKRLLIGNKNRDKYKKIIDEGISLKRVSNGYTVNVYRDESRHGVTENKSQEERRPSILVRQIQRTRDKNLRVKLLEQELSARLPRVDACLTLNRALNARQLSSPLC